MDKKPRKQLESVQTLNRQKKKNGVLNEYESSSAMFRTQTERERRGSHAALIKCEERRSKRVLAPIDISISGTVR